MVGAIPTLLRNHFKIYGKLENVKLNIAGFLDICTPTPKADFGEFEMSRIGSFLYQDHKSGAEGGFLPYKVTKLP